MLPDRVARFTASERAVHWLTTGAFFSLLITGLIVGRRGTFHDIMYIWHLASAAVLLGGLALIVAAGDRRAVSRTARELGRLDPQDREWLRTIPARLLEHAPEPPAARFNAGQKLNFALVCVLVAGHLYMALVNPTTRTALSGMLTGKVDREWARRHYPRWKP